MRRARSTKEAGGGAAGAGPVIAAIDPSLTGTAAVFGREGFSERFEVTSKPTGQRLVHRHRRYGAIMDRLWNAYVKWRPTLALIEGYSMGSRGRGVTGMVELGWTIRDRLLPGTPVVEVPPSTLKKFATGRGNAGKPEVVSALTKRYGIEFRTDNEADAYALYRLGLCVTGQAEATNNDQRSVVAMVRGLLDAEVAV